MNKSMRDAAPQKIRRDAYQPPQYWVDHIALDITLVPDDTRVSASLSFRSNRDHPEDQVLTLNGEHIALISVMLDGEPLPAAQIEHANDLLRIRGLPASGVLTIQSRCNPRANTALEGLYITGDTFCTQCEAEGFRRIAFFPDRPDVMAKYQVTMRAEKSKYPVLLANGNLVQSRDLADGMHEAVWEDPYPKPCYLFALVAGDVGKISEHFITRSGRSVLLEIYAKPHNLDQCTFAMDALQKSMRWDEDAYGREYDLDRFMIYCADDFNFGAMENKGLNIFNAALLLGKQETATDNDFAHIEAVVAHEYFHNWSGNRVTCRDWFQLSLKEGFTVLRDQQFSADVGSAAVERVAQVEFLRQHQFVEDAGPLSHPVRPDEYVTIDNFYTLTIYEKGAEVVRMLHTMLGATVFRAGTDFYFSQNDGRAATCDDFVAAMESASGRDLTQFKRWYATPGTPTICAAGIYDTAKKSYTLNLSQTSSRADEPLLIPVSVGLLDATGKTTHPTRVLELSQSAQSFTFNDVVSEPVPSILRGFSAPVHVEIDRNDATLAFLAQHDDDAVNRWDAFQTIKERAITAVMRGDLLPPAFDACIIALLADTTADPALIAQMLRMPAAEAVSGLANGYAPLAVVRACAQLSTHISRTHAGALATTLERTRGAGSYAFTPQQRALRALNGAALTLFCGGDDPQAIAMAYRGYQHADNMTDRQAALSALANSARSERQRALDDFYEKFKGETLVINKWMALQAESAVGGTVAGVRKLMAHPAFDARNPNKLRAVLAGFGMRNWQNFHAIDGSGYAFMTEQVLAVDARNPNIAAKVIGAFSRWKECDPTASAGQQHALQAIRGTHGLSENLIELTDKLLA